MTAQPDRLDPDMAVVLEIIQHAGEILTRLPLSALRSCLEQHREDDEYGAWFSAAVGLTVAAQQLDVSTAQLAAVEARAKPKPVRRIESIPDDWSLDG